MKDLEKRSFTIELRKEGNEENKRMVGHAAIFNEEAKIGSSFREKIAPGAFAESVQKDDVRALFNHDPNYVLGRNRAGTLKMNEDDRGLAIEIDPPDTSFAKDLAISMERGDITQMSFAFRVEGEEWEYGDGEELDLRTITKAKLYDVSPVTYPAYEGTDIGLRSHDAWREAEKAKKDAEKPAVPDYDLMKKRLGLRARD